MNEDIFERLRANKKYGDIHPDAIRRALEDAERRYRKPRDIEKAARERLHGISAAFADLGKPLPSDELEALLSSHASTRERLPLARMEAMYARIFAVTGVPERALDLACGLDPLFLLRKYDCAVTGVDVSRRCIELLLREPNFTGVWADLLTPGAVPAEHFPLALLFKILPLLERQQPGSALALMERVDARHLVVSFPTRTLGGRNVNMARNYSEWMEAHLPAARRVEERFEDENELFFILGEK